MERMMLGRDILDSDSFDHKSGFSECSLIVKKGHEECGDSGFFFCDRKKAIIGIFDGVSGEPGAASASSEAANSILSSLKPHDHIDEKILKDAFSKASLAVEHGYTTAAVCFLEKGGRVIVAGAGDSPIYSLSLRELVLELPIDRPAGANDSILKFTSLRNIVSSVLGPTGGDLEVHIREGKLAKGDIIILASDGLLDNLALETEDGYIKDASGIRDLARIIGRKRNPKAVIKALVAEIENRFRSGKEQSPDRLLLPKNDDIAIAVLKRL